MSIQMEQDTHMMAAPFRLLWHMILLTLFILSAPVIATVLLLNAYCGASIRPWLLSIYWFPPIWANQLIGSSPSAEEVFIMKPFSVVLIPLVVASWSALIVGIYEKKRGIRSHAGVLLLVFFFVGLIGAAFAGMWFRNADASTYFPMVTIGSFIPVLVRLIANLFRRPAASEYVTI